MYSTLNCLFETGYIYSTVYILSIRKLALPRWKIKKTSRVELQSGKVSSEDMIHDFYVTSEKN